MEEYLPHGGGVLRLSETAYTRGDFNVVERLKAVPAVEIRRMQDALHAGARRLQYAIDDVPGDAFETLLTGARDLAVRRERANGGRPPGLRDS